MAINQSLGRVRAEDQQDQKILIPLLATCSCSATLKVVPCLFSVSPTDPFTIFELHYPQMDKLYVVRKRQSTDFEALKLWKGRSGRWLDFSVYDSSESPLTSPHTIRRIEKRKRRKKERRFFSLYPESFNSQWTPRPGEERINISLGQNSDAKCVLVKIQRMLQLGI